MTPEWADALPMLLASLAASAVLGWAWLKDANDARVKAATPLARVITRVK